MDSLLRYRQGKQQGMAKHTETRTNGKPVSSLELKRQGKEAGTKAQQDL